jgi:hypothetical protein
MNTSTKHLPKSEDHSKWISFEDMIPRKNDWVVILYEGGALELRMFVYVSSIMTHWMKIPDFGSD